MTIDNPEVAAAPEGTYTSHDIRPVGFVLKLSGQREARLYLDDNGRIAFEGDVAESAEILFNEVCRLWNKPQG